MAGFAFEMLHGRLTHDPDERDYNKKDGTKGKMTTFTVAVDARFGDATYYHDCAAFGRTAEIIAAHFHKGQEIVTWGEPTYNDREDKNGNGKRRFHTLNVIGFDFCGAKADSDTPQATKDSFEQIDDDTPF